MSHNRVMNVLLGTASLLLLPMRSVALDERGYVLSPQRWERRADYVVLTGHKEKK